VERKAHPGLGKKKKRREEKRNGEEG